MEKKTYYCDCCKEFIPKTMTGRNELRIENWEIQKEGENIFTPRIFHLCDKCIAKVKTFLTKEL